MTTPSNKSIIQSYFDAFGRGDLDRVLDHFHPDCFIVSVREGDRDPGQLHGSYHTRNEARDFLNNIHNLFLPDTMSVTSLMEAEDNVVYAHGKFAHRVKATGKLFRSDWVQRCVIRDGKIAEYRFYEDSAAFERAAS